MLNSPNSKKWHYFFSFILFLAVFFFFGCGTVNGYSSTGGSWSFAVICDTRGNADSPNDLPNPDNWVNTPAVKAIATEIANYDVDLVLAPGDMILGNLFGLHHRYITS